MSRKLIIYYSRSNATRKLAGELVKELGADVVTLQERQSRAGLTGYMRSLWDASRGVLPPIDPLYVDPRNYDLILLGTPVWAGRAACPMRRFLCDAAHRLPPTAYFCTYGGRGYETTFSDMCDLDGKAPVATLAVRRSDLLQGHYTTKLDRFMAKLNIAERWREIIAPANHSVLLHGG
jgi:hypothetical protein